MNASNRTPPRWALALAGVIAAAEIVAQPLIPDGWPALVNFTAVLGLARAAWRVWPFHPDD